LKIGQLIQKFGEVRFLKIQHYHIIMDMGQRFIKLVVLLIGHMVHKNKQQLEKNFLVRLKQLKKQ
jgi:hypothetical protein